MFWQTAEVINNNSTFNKSLATQLQEYFLLYSLTQPPPLELLQNDNRVWRKQIWDLYLGTAINEELVRESLSEVNKQKVWQAEAKTDRDYHIRTAEKNVKVSVHNNNNNNIMFSNHNVFYALQTNAIFSILHNYRILISPTVTQMARTTYTDAHAHLITFRVICASRQSRIMIMFYVHNATTRQYTVN